MPRFDCPGCDDEFDKFYKLVEHVTKKHPEIAQIERTKKNGR
jgi:hypothetical protein